MTVLWIQHAKGCRAVLMTAGFSITVRFKIGSGATQWTRQPTEAQIVMIAMLFS